MTHAVARTAEPGRPRARAGPARAAVLAVVTVGTVSTVGFLAAMARTDPAHAGALGMQMSGVNALLAGLVAVGHAVRRRHQGRAGEVPRLLLGLAVIVWGIGQTLIAIRLTTAGVRTFGPGDLVSVGAAPLAALAMMRMPRRRRSSRPAVGLSLDAMIVTSTITIAVWWWWIQPALPDPAHPGGAAVAAVWAMLFDVVVVALCLLIAARDGRRGALTLGIGAGFQAVADVLSLPAVVDGGAVPWISGALWCVGIPVIGAGLVMYRTLPVALGSDAVLEDLGESRATMIATVTSLIVLGATMVTDQQHRWTVIGTSLFVVSIGLLVVREAMNSRIRSRLVTWLSTEALRDALTDLPNRRALTTMIRGVDLTTPWVLLTVDLDGFKEVNDLLGPEAGDDLIVAVAGALQRTCPASGVVARIGGDEFGVLAPGTVEDGERLTERLAAAVRTTVHDREIGVALSASVGVGRVLPEPAAPASSDRASAPTADPTSPTAGPSSPAADVEPRGRLTALVESAAALRAAKAIGRDQVAVYPGAVERARERRLLLERRLRAALDAGTLDMHAQPLIHLRSGRIAGFESLARWTDELLGSVSPAEFVPVAEQAGLVTTLGEFALRNTLLQALAGGVTGWDVELGVNVSPIQLRLPSFAPMVVDLVAELGLAPHQLLLEVTEAILVDEDDPASGSLAALAAAGVQLAIDDFGTGYSALGYLRRLPVDMLKIDRSWVVASVHDQRTRDIVGGVISLAHTLGATVVMEGIEDAETARMCVDVGADLGQGFLFGRPQPWPLAAEELRAAPWRPGAVPEPDAQQAAGVPSPRAADASADVSADPVGARGPRSRPGGPRGATS